MSLNRATSASVMARGGAGMGGDTRTRPGGAVVGIVL